MRCAAPAYAHARPAMRFFDRRARGASRRTARGRVSPAARTFAAPAISAIYFAYFARTCAFASLHIKRLESHASFRISCVSLFFLFLFPRHVRPSHRGRHRAARSTSAAWRDALSRIKSRFEWCRERVVSRETLDRRGSGGGDVLDARYGAGTDALPPLSRARARRERSWMTTLQAFSDATDEHRPSLSVRFVRVARR